MAEDSRPSEWTPRPDPTLLTTEALQREISHLREYLESLVASHRLLDAQKFDSIEQRFQDRDLLTSQAFDNVSEGTRAALASSKEAVGKSEADVAKQLDALRTLIDTRVSANAAQIADLKERLGKLETRGTTTTQLIVIGVSLAAVITAIVSFVLTTAAP